MNRKILTVVAIICCNLQLSAQVKPLPFTNYIQNRGGLVNVAHSINTQKDLTVAFLGGSITFNPGWSDMVSNYLKKTYPQVKFKFIAAGIPSLGSLPHVFRLQRDVLDSGKVDLLFLEAAVNDQVNGTDSLTQVRDLEGIVRHAFKSNPYMDIVMMEFADPDKTNLYKQGKVPTSIANHELVATHYNLPTINLAKTVADKLANNEFNWEKDFKDLHPSPFGQQLYFDAIKTFLGAQLNGKGKIQKHNIDKITLLNANSFTNGSYLSIDYAKPDANWTFYKSWKPADKIGTRDGFVNVPVLESAKAGAALTLKFEGNAIGIAIVSGADAGIINYSVDNGPMKNIDLYTQWSSFLHLPWYLLLGSALPTGPHELKLTISDQKNKNSLGNACRIVYFLVNK